jgi:hypothetical protein
MRRLLLIIVAAVSLCGLSCKWLSTRKYNVDRTSPNGVHRVKVNVRVEDEGGVFGGFTERGEVQFFKGAELVDAHEWQITDNWEPTFIDANPRIEWVEGNVLRMGSDNSGQRVLDEFTVSNNTDERLKYIGVTFSKYESFKVFDLPAGSSVTLRVTPELDADGSSSTYWLGYSGVMEGGKMFEGTAKETRNRTVVGTPLRFQIAINAKDLR